MRIATPWIYSLKFDLAAIIGPPVAITAVVIAFGNQIAKVTQTPTWLWVLLVLGIDVAHVYSSLFRTYFDPEEFKKRKALYVAVPLATWSVSTLIFHFLGPNFFWSCVAYFAIYHFVRQQYGFMMLYRRGEPTGDLSYRIDQLAIYLATLYPLLYWHTYPRNFQWFSDFDVVRIPFIWPELVVKYLYLAILIAFFAKEVHVWQTTKKVNLGKVLLLASTAASWYTGIVVFNGDLTFTLVNIVSHGVPYLALVWIYQYRKRSKASSVRRPYLNFFQLKYVPIYILSLMGLSYFEEKIWDNYVWQEHANLFGNLSAPAATTSLLFLVPILTTPQVTHYILDAYIWRVNKPGSDEVRSVIG